MMNTGEPKPGGLDGACEYSPIPQNNIQGDEPIDVWDVTRTLALALTFS